MIIMTMIMFVLHLSFSLRLQTIGGGDIHLMVILNSINQTETRFKKGLKNRTTEGELWGGGALTLI